MRVKSEFSVAVFAVFVVTAALFPINTEAGMNPFGFLKIVVFTEMQGQVIKGGKPVAGIKLVRTADYNGTRQFKDEQITDSEGRFRFKEWSFYSLAAMIIETNVNQKIVIIEDNQERLAWSVFKQNNHSGGEIRYFPENIDAIAYDCICSLDNSDDQKRRFKYLKISKTEWEYKTVRGICELQGIESEIRY